MAVPLFDKRPAARHRGLSQGTAAPERSLAVAPQSHSHTSDQGPFKISGHVPQCPFISTRTKALTPPSKGTACLQPCLKAKERIPPRTGQEGVLLLARIQTLVSEMGGFVAFCICHLDTKCSDLFLLI